MKNNKSILYGHKQKLCIVFWNYDIYLQNENNLLHTAGK